jgi:signal transduction histidine kinase/DNA-binding response OmpR family regulator
MHTPDGPLKLRIIPAKDKEIEQSILDAIESAGFQYELYVDGIDQCDAEEVLSFNVLLVDWRNGDLDIAKQFASRAGRSPVVALVSNDQQYPDLHLLAGFNDFICASELTSSSFKLRLHRLDSRYRDPISVVSTNTPEARLLQTVVDQTSDWLFIKDLDHRFLAVSQEYTKSIDKELSSVIGKNDLEIGFAEEVVLGSDTADWPGFWPQDDKAVELGVPQVENNPEWRVMTGDTRHRRTTRVPLKNSWGQVYALLICSEDVTTIVKTEEILRERNNMLEKVTQEKTKAEHSRLMAELAVTAKNKFIATASHDLRQPLHALGLYLDVLEAKIKRDDELELIAKIKNSSTALSVLFNSLLDLSRLDAGVVEVVPTHFSVHCLLSRLALEFDEIAVDKALDFDIETVEDIVFTDAVLLERILRNLIQNAITYTEKGSIAVRCESSGKALRIDIADTGPGIPQYEQHAIFSEYYQLDNKGHRPTIGLGLGLAIVKRLVDLLQVKFELESKEGVGSIFSIYIPLGDARQIAFDASANETQELTGHTILVIDDESDILDSMQMVLGPYGGKVVTAPTANDAITKLNEDDLAPTMIVADYRLKEGKTGVDAIAYIREEFNQEIPAIIITGDTSAKRLKEATASGFRLVHKPLQVDDLLGEISAVLSSSEA